MSLTSGSYSMDYDAIIVGASVAGAFEVKRHDLSSEVTP